MKRIIQLIGFWIVLLLCSCTKDDNLSINSEGQKFTISLMPQAQYLNGEGSLSKSTTVTLDRYIMEVYSDNACTVPVNVFGNTNHKEQTTADFTMMLDASKGYTCLFWADNQSSSVYDVSDLRSVKLKSGQINTEAFYLKYAINSTASTRNVMLQRAVAKVVLKDNLGAIGGRTVNLKYTQASAFSVLDGTTSSPIAVDRNVTTLSSLANQEFASFYMFAGSTATNFKLTANYDNTGSIDINTIPIQANKCTNVAGSYATRYAIGDQFPKTGTAIGVVYSVVDNGIHGKILSLDEKRNVTCAQGVNYALAKTSGNKVWRLTNIDELESMYCALKKIKQQTWDVAHQYPADNTPLVASYDIRTSLSSLSGAPFSETDQMGYTIQYWSSSNSNDPYLPGFFIVDFSTGYIDCYEDGFVMNVRFVTDF